MGKLHGTEIPLPCLASQESTSEAQFEKCPLHRDKFLAGLEMKGFDMKQSERWLFSYNCVGLFELKAPALHSTRWEGHMQNLTIQPMASPPALALFSVWACCRCRRQDQWELAVCYLPLSWEICWECRSRSYCSPERILSQIFFQLCCGSDTCGFVSQLLTVHTAPFTPFAVQWVGLLILKIRHLMYICVVCYN